MKSHTGERNYEVGISKTSELQIVIYFSTFSVHFAESDFYTATTSPLMLGMCTIEKSEKKTKKHVHFAERFITLNIHIKGLKVNSSFFTF